MRFNPTQLLFGDSMGCSSCQNRSSSCNSGATFGSFGNCGNSRSRCGCGCAVEPCSQTLTFCTSTPTIIGCTRPFCTIVLQIDQQRYEAAADQGGIWTATIIQPLALGSHRASVTEYCCNCARQKEMIVYIFPSNTVTIATPPNNAILNASPTEITGTATPFAPVTVSLVNSLGGTTTLKTTADALGNYSVTIVTPLTSGTYVINAQAQLSPCPPATATSTFTVTIEE